MKSLVNFSKGNSQDIFKGVISALPTPFENNGANKKVDFASLAKLVEFQLKNGIQGFVVNGTTAESPTLAWAEVEKIYSCVREISGNAVPIILGSGSNSTEQTIATTKKAEALGADAALVVVPYYNKPPQRGLEAHFTVIAKNTKLPIILYNVPARTITAMTAETIVALSKVGNIIAIKEASGDISFVEKLKKQLTEQLTAEFVLLSGDDLTYLPFLKLGGSGIISVMSNVLTAACVKWSSLAAANSWAKVEVELETDFAQYKNLISLMYVEANPIPLKWMLYKMGLFKTPEMRLPLVVLENKYHEAVTAELKKQEII